MSKQPSAHAQLTDLDKLERLLAEARGEWWLMNPALLVAMHEALPGLIAEARASRWQLIETADTGAFVMLFDPAYGVYMGRPVDYGEATHWMPLPAAPGVQAVLIRDHLRRMAMPDSEVTRRAAESEPVPPPGYCYVPPSGAPDDGGDMVPVAESEVPHG